MPPRWLQAPALPFAIAGAAPGPCDILGSAGNPCVAAHSTTRALYSAYAGPLYSVTRASDNASFSVPLLAPGGFADTRAHDSFCSALDCVISSVFDQSPQGNHLKQRHKLVNASRLRVAVGDGVPVYGMWFDPGFGYHVDATTGIATGNDPETLFAVMSGTHYNGACCFECVRGGRRGVRARALTHPHRITPLSHTFAAATAIPRLTTRQTAQARWKRSTSATRGGRAMRARVTGRGWGLIWRRACTTGVAPSQRSTMRARR